MPRPMLSFEMLLDADVLVAGSARLIGSSAAQRRTLEARATGTRGMRPAVSDGGGPIGKTADVLWSAA